MTSLEGQIATCTCEILAKFPLTSLGTRPQPRPRVHLETTADISNAIPKAFPMPTAVGYALLGHKLLKSFIRIMTSDNDGGMACVAAMLPVEQFLHSMLPPTHPGTHRLEPGRIAFGECMAKNKPAFHADCCKC